MVVLSNVVVLSGSLLNVYCYVMLSMLSNVMSSNVI